MSHLLSLVRSLLSARRSAAVVIAAAAATNGQSVTKQRPVWCTA